MELDSNGSNVFAIEVFKPRVLGSSSVKAGSEPVAVGAMATVLAYGVGWLLRGVADSI